MADKKTKKKYEAHIELPHGCTFTREDGHVAVKGPKGELKRELQDKRIRTSMEGNTLSLSFDKISQREKKSLFTASAHIKNMLKGVTEGFNYKLKICSGHFPMSVTIKGDMYEVKNFIGEKVPRQLKIKPGVKVVITGEIIDVDGTDKELTGSTAAAIEKLTRRPGFDKRIFQDGVYIFEKNGKKI